MIDLEKKYLDFVKQTIASYLKDYKLYIFGSRTKNKAKEYSDIDLAIDSTELTPKIKSKIEAFFEDSTLPYEVDIIDLNNVTESFKQLIKEDLIKI